MDRLGEVIFLTLAGSQAHGTAGPGSDVDLRGVCITPLSVRLSLFESFEQHEGPLPDALAVRVLPRLRAHPTASAALDVKLESVIFDVAKLLRLCEAANPNALEILFADRSDWVLEAPGWRTLHAARHLFLTRRVQQTFLGYAMAQLRRIETHRAWLLHPPARKPDRADFGLPAAGSALSRDDQNRMEQALAERIRAYGLQGIDMPKASRIAAQERMDAFQRDVLGVPEDEVEARTRAVASHALGLPTDVVTTLNAEKRYRSAMKHWQSYQSWKAKRNPARARLEAAHGYDTKHAMHLIRLMRMGVEALEHGDLQVRRPDAHELLAIRDGALSYEALLAEAQRLQQAMGEAAEGSPLPERVDRDRVDRLLMELVTP